MLALIAEAFAACRIIPKFEIIFPVTTQRIKKMTLSRLPGLSTDQYASLQECYSCRFGVAALSAKMQKIHAISVITFNESYTKAKIHFTKDQMHLGWPSYIPDPSPNAAPGFATVWSESATSPLMDPSFLNKSLLLEKFREHCFSSVKHVTIRIDPESSPIEKLVVLLCRSKFKNLESYTLNSVRHKNRSQKKEIIQNFWFIQSGANG
ncbi:MAG: hypothetical protein ACK5MA_06305 [Parachlamydiaceae bacterium]